MSDEINFVDLAALMKIGPDTTSEKFGVLINSSYFDGANLLGVLYQKRLVSLTTAFPGPNPVTVTDTGRALLTEADTRAKEEFDHLDFSILTQLANGKRSLADLAGAVNVRPRDLAMHLYKMVKNNYATYDFRSGTVDIMLTEKGYTQARSGMPQKPGMQQPAAPKMMGTPQPAQGMMAAPAPEAMLAPGSEQAPMGAPIPAAEMPAAPQPMTAQEVEAQVKAKKAQKKLWLILAVVVIIVVVAAVAHFVLKLF